MPEVLPPVRDGGDPVREVLGEQLMEVDHARVGVQRAEPPRKRVARLVAQLRRAEMRLRLDDVELASSEQREEVAWVVVVDRQLVRTRQPPGEERRDAVQGSFRDDALVRKPRRVALELGEVREANRIDDPSPVEQRVGRELVEDDDDGRRIRPDVGGVGARRARERQPRGVRAEQKQRQKEQRRRSEHRQDEPRGGEPQVERGGGEAHGPGQHGQEPAGLTSAPNRLEDKEPDERRRQESTDRRRDPRRRSEALQRTTIARCARSEDGTTARSVANHARD